MKVYFDSSVLVPAIVKVHPNHEAASRELDRVHAGEFTGIVTSHGLAETWAVATGLPVRPPVSTDHVKEVLRLGVMAKFDVIRLTADEYARAIEEATRVGLRGGALYDLLHLRAARAASVERILTYDLRDFRRIAPDLADQIRTP